MNLLTMKGRASARPKTGHLCLGRIVRWPLLAAVVSFALVLGQGSATALAAPAPNAKRAIEKKPKPKKADSPKAAAQPKAKAGCGSSCGSGGSCGGASADPTPDTATGGPGPQWVCDETTVRPDPVWRGAQLECAFNIRNEGKRNLKIKARGG